jgi:hypothetical protein
MAENIPNAPAGAVPPKKETGKVQPKKETVRITLPPKPTAAPTIKLPTLPPGGPGAAAKAAPGPAAAPRPGAAPAAAAPRAGAPGTALASGGAPRSAAAPGVKQAARTAPRPSAAGPANKTDGILAIVAAALGLIAVGTTVYLAWLM